MVLVRVALLSLIGTISFGGFVPFAAGGVEGACRSAEACFEQAKTLSKGDPAKAAETFRGLAARFPGTVWAGRAALELGRLAQALNDPSAAMWWSKAATEAPVLADYAHYALAQLALARQDWHTAASTLESLLATHPQSLWIVPSLYELGEAYRQLADCPRARDRWEELATRAPRDPLAVTAWSKIADCFMAEGRLVSAVTVLRRLWWEAPDAQEAVEVIRHLGELVIRLPVAGPTADERYQRAVNLAAASRYQAAVEELEAFVHQAPEDPRRDGALLRVAVARYQLKQYRIAQRDLVRLAETIRDPELRVETLWWLARVFARLDDEVGLLKAIRRLEAYPHDSRRTRALVLLGEFYTARRDPAQAIRAFERVLTATEPEDTTLIEDARWHVGWLHYQTGRPDAAIRAFEQFRRLSPRSILLPQVLYWEARSHERMAERPAAGGPKTAGLGSRQEHAKTAAALYAAVCRDYRHTYYCHQAEMRFLALAGLLGFDPLVAVTETRTDDLPVSEAPLPPAQDLHYRKAKELLVLDWRSDAARELRAVGDRVTDRAVLLGVAARLYDAGDYTFPLRTLQRHFQAHLVQGSVELPPWFRQMAYPMGYLEFASPYEGPALDRLLVAAVMREESAFDPRAVSRSGAIGLMQVLPTTAQWVARRSGLAPPDPASLFDQELNVRLGTSYLAHLASQFAGDPVLMAAGYNAGPQAVTQWLQARQQGSGQGYVEWDEFIETIPFLETRFYVKRVLRSYVEYLRDASRH